MKRNCFLLILAMILAVAFTAPAEEAAAPAKEPLSLEEGDLVFFGRYEQDGSLGNGPEPVLWIVLEAGDGDALLVSQYELAYREYTENTDQGRNTAGWENSSLRTWLNSEFLAGAFTEQEQAFIRETALHTDGDRQAGLWLGKSVDYVIPGSDTTDRVFLLDKNEVETLFAFGSTNPYSLDEHTLSVPTYAALSDYYDRETSEPLAELYDFSGYQALISRLFPLAEQSEDGWFVRLPALDDYTLFWQDPGDLFESFALRNQGMLYSIYNDGSGSPHWYDFYCSGSGMYIRPALRINLEAFSAGAAEKAAPVSPCAPDDALTGKWQCSIEDTEIYFVFKEDGRRMQVGYQRGDDPCQIVDAVFQAENGQLRFAQRGYHGTVSMFFYQVDGDKLTLSLDDQAYDLTRVIPEE